MWKNKTSYLKQDRSLNFVASNCSFLCKSMSHGYSISIHTHSVASHVCENCHVFSCCAHLEVEDRLKQIKSETLTTRSGSFRNFTPAPVPSLEVCCNCVVLRLQNDT